MVEKVLEVCLQLPGVAPQPCPRYSPADGGGGRVTEGLETAVKDRAEHRQRCCQGGSLSSSLFHEDNAFLPFADHGTGAPLRFLMFAEGLPLTGSGGVFSLMRV